MENQYKRLTELDEKMYHLNANLSALIHIQKLKSLDEAKEFLLKINREIGEWISLRSMERFNNVKITLI